MAKCDVCNKEICEDSVTIGFSGGVSYKDCCECIPRKTLRKCIELSLDNAQRLVEDAESLIKTNKLSSAYILAVYALEECGKALLALDHFSKKKKISIKEYRRKFKNHKLKIKRALEAVDYPNELSPSFSSRLRSKTLDSIFVSFNEKHRLWTIPWNEDPISLLKQHEYLASESPEIFNIQIAMKMRKAQTMIQRAVVQMVVERCKSILQAREIFPN